MKLKLYIYPGGPSLNEIQSQLEALEPPLSEQILRQAKSFSSQIFERTQNTQSLGDQTHYKQNQTISDNNHTILICGRMSPPSFWETIAGRILG